MTFGISFRFNAALVVLISVIYCALLLFLSSEQRESYESLSTLTYDVLSRNMTEQIQGMEDEQNVKLQRLGQLLAKIAPPSINVFDIGALEQYAETAISDPDIKAVRFVSPDGTLIAGSGKADAGSESEATLRTDILSEGDKIGVLEMIFSKQRIHKAIAKVEGNTLSLLTEIEKEAKASVHSLIVTLIVSGVILVTLFAGLGYFLFRWLVDDPLQGIAAAMKRLAQGNLEIQIPGMKRRDEIGVMAEAVHVFRDNAQQIHHLHEQSEEARQRAEAEKRHTLLTLARELEGKVGSAVQTVSLGIGQIITTSLGMGCKIDSAASPLPDRRGNQRTHHRQSGTSPRRPINCRRPSPKSPAKSPTPTTR